MGIVLSHWRAGLMSCLLGLLASCGGGSEPSNPLAEQELLSQASDALRRRASGLQVQQTKIPSLDLQAEQVMDFAEQQFKHLFPEHSPTRLAAPFNYRFYPATGICLGIVVGASTEYQTGGVYLMGGSFGEKPVLVGTTAQYLDSDQDGVANAQDAAAADPLCSQAVDAHEGNCHWRSLALTQLRVLGSSGDTLYLSSIGDQTLIYAYDLRTGHFSARVPISGLAPTVTVYSADQARFYIGDSLGKVRALNEAFVEIGAPIAAVRKAVTGMTVAGSHVLVRSADGLARFDRYGIESSAEGLTNESVISGVWSAVNSRLYFVTSGSPTDVLYLELDGATGKVRMAKDSPYHGEYRMYGPLRLNPSATRLLLGSGHMFSADTLTWAGRLPTDSILDMLWLNDTDTVTATRSGTRVRLQRFDGTRQFIEAMDLPPGGELIGLIRRGNDVHWLLKHTDRVQLGVFTPSDDSDKDGVPNGQDKFPLDPAAAADTDGDGRPDAWLPGRSQVDSIDGLTLEPIRWMPPAMHPSKAMAACATPAITRPRADPPACWWMGAAWSTCSTAPCTT